MNRITIEIINHYFYAIINSYNPKPIKSVTMKKYLILFLVMNCAFIFISAQTYVANIRNNAGLWGYINMQGETVIEAKFDNAKEFSEDGFAMVKEVDADDYHFINIKGEKLELNCAPAAIKAFNNGRAMVKIGDKWGFIDTKGELVIPAEYDNVSRFNNDRAFVKDENKTVYLIDKSGVKVDLKGLKIIAYKEFTEGLARVKVGSTWGFINKEGELAIEAKYSKVRVFSGGLAAAKIGKDKFGYINKEGDFVLEPAYDAASEFDTSSDLARVKIGKQWMYVNKNSEKLIIQADHFHDFSEGLLRTDKLSAPGVYGFVNAQGEWIIDPQFERTGDFHFGKCRIRKNENWGLIDKKGNIVIEAQYDRFEDFVKIEP